VPVDDYRGSDFCCDVALPDPSRLRVVHENERVLASTTLARSGTSTSSSSPSGTSPR